MSAGLVHTRVSAPWLAIVALGLALGGAALVPASTGGDGVRARSAENYIKLAKYSPDGRAIIGPALLDGSVTVWDSVTGKRLYMLDGHSQRTYTVRYRPDGKRIVTGSYDGTAKIWDAGTGALIHTLDCRPGWPIDAAYSPDGDRVLTIGWFVDDTIGVYVAHATMWNAETGRQVFTLRDLGPDGISDAAFSSDGTLLATRSLASREVRVWNARTGELLHRLGGHRGSIFGILWSPDGRRLITMGSDLASKMWDATTGKLLYTFSVRGVATSFAEFSPDGRHVLTSDFDDIARIWDVETGTIVHALAAHHESVGWSRYSSDGLLVVTPSYDRTARIWDARTGQVKLVLRGHGNIVTYAEFDPGGQRVVTYSLDNTAKLWDVRTGALLYSIGIQNTDEFSEKLGGFEFRNDGAQLIVPMTFHDIRVFDAATGARQFTLVPDGDIDK